MRQSEEERDALMSGESLRERLAAATSTTMFVPRVASPFTQTELDFFNAVRIADTFDPGYPTGEVSEDGIDTNRDARVEVGWDNIDALRSYTETLEVGYDLCQDEYRNRFIEFDDDGRAEWRERFAVISRAYLC